MKKSLVLAMAMAMGISATAFAANPFSDVPAGHWAYGSISKLAAAGIVDGYPDGTFKGDNLMTRYEMAQIVAKAYAKGAIGSDDKLMAEFADELDNLGVRVAKLEKKADNVKITGQIRFSYKDVDGENGVSDSNSAKLRSRLWVAGAVNDDWTYTAMLQNEQNLKTNSEESTGSDFRFRRAYVDGKIGGLQVRAGRYNFTAIDGNVWDAPLDGATLTFGSKLKATVTAGRFDGARADGVTDNTDGIIGILNYDLGSLDLNAAYYKFDEQFAANEDNKIWSVGAAYAFDKNINLTGEYIKSDQESYGNDDGYVIGLNYKGASAAKVGSFGIWAKYHDQPEATVVCHTMDGFYDLDGGFDGFNVGANYTLAKNIIAKVQYWDLDAKNGNGTAKTLWSDVTFTF